MGHNGHASGGCITTCLIDGIIERKSLSAFGLEMNAIKVANNIRTTSPAMKLLSSSCFNTVLP